VEVRLPELASKTAVVTGGSRGIGRAIVERLAADGVRVVFSYVSNKEAAVEVVEAVRAAGGEAHAVKADLGNIDEVRALFAAAESLVGRPDIVVNNAATGTPVSIVDVTEEEYDRVMNTNAKGTFFALQEAARRLLDGGRIVNISTVNTVLPAPSNALYQGSKGAIEQFTRVASRELGPRGITVNTVSPGATDTDLLRSSNPPEALEQVPAFTPLGRLGQPADVAAVVAFLVGPDGGWVTGQNIAAGGGLP
jgi:3-oxoacyl-[acyl-carrier protein] reductase